MQRQGSHGITRTYERDRTSLADLAGLDLETLEDGDLLQWDSDNEVWLTISIGNLSDQMAELFSLNDLSDVDLDTLSNGQLLVYNGSEWVNYLPTIEELDGISVDEAQEGDLLVYNGSEWVNVNKESLFGFNDGQLIQTVGEPSGLRIIRGRVADNGTPLHGGGFTSSYTSTGRASISFSYAFPEVPSCVVIPEYNVTSNRMRCVSYTSMATGGFSVAFQEWDGSDWVDISVNFAFIVIGMAGNY